MGGRAGGSLGWDGPGSFRLGWQAIDVFLGGAGGYQNPVLTGGFFCLMSSHVFFLFSSVCCRTGLVVNLTVGNTAETGWRAGILVLSYTPQVYG